MPSTDARIAAATLYFLPVETRSPYRFGAESLTHATLARVSLRVRGRNGSHAVGWGETPLSVPWAWPSPLPFARRESSMLGFCKTLCVMWTDAAQRGHPLEIGHVMALELPALARAHDAEMPILAALVCASAFDLALHDAFGHLHRRPTYELLGADFVRHGLSAFLEPDGKGVDFRGRHVSDFLLPQRLESLDAWHSVGLGDALDESDLDGSEPDDGFPNTLGAWIERDGLRCLKVKVRGEDLDDDFERLARVGAIGLPRGVEALCADFNCTAKSVESVCATLDRLRKDAPAVFNALLYVEQPFADTPAAMELDVRRISRRKPLFLDESAHDWRAVREARACGYTGVALKTCKTQSGALLSACWARAHGMDLMVQDLTNPELAMVPHALLAAHVGTLRGIESNAPQFYPRASEPEARVHPELYKRRGGCISLESVRGPGFGQRVDEIARELPAPASTCEA